MGKRKKKPYQTIPNLPIDIRIIPDIFSFSHVKGVARIFLYTEIILSTLIVLGTVVLLIIRIVIPS